MAFRTPQRLGGGWVQGRVRGDGCRALAEAAALCLERLLALARSLASSLRYGKPADDGIRWPTDARVAVAMLRCQVCASCSCNESCMRDLHVLWSCCVL